MKIFSRSSTLISALFTLLGLLSPQSAHGQVTYVSPQTVYQQVFFGQTAAAPSPNSNTQTRCIPTTGNPCGIPNLGQSIHAVVYSISSPCTTGFAMDLRIEASNDGTNWFSISEDATDQNSGSIQGSTVGGLTASGSYNNFRLNLVRLACASGQTPALSANYSGTSTSNPTATGVFYQSSPYRKVILQNVATTATPSPVTINAPNGNTAGALYLSCFIAASGASTNCPSTLIISVNGLIAWGSAVGGGGGGNVSSGSANYSPAATVAPIIQLINVPAMSINFQFSGTGTAGVNWSVYYMSNFTSLPNFVGDPCQSPGAIKQSARANIVVASTSRVIQGTPGLVTFVCSMTVNMVGTTAADTLQLVGGTGTNCSTVNQTITPIFSSGILANGATNLTISGAATQFSTQPGNDICAVTTVGSSPNIALLFTFVQQ